MSDFISMLHANPWIIIASGAAIGYLVGSISVARIVYSLATGSHEYEPFAEPVPHTDKTFESDLISATWVTKKLNRKYGCATSILDMAKVAVPTLVFRLLFPTQPYFLLVALCGIAGHNYPIYYRFNGGRGESPILGALLVTNWFGLLVTNAAATIIGYVVGSVLVVRWGAYVLFILWFWLYFNDWWYVAFAVGANFLFWFSMRDDLKTFQELKNQGHEFSQEDVSEFIMMGKTLGRFLDKYGLFHVVGRLLKKWQQGN